MERRGERMREIEEELRAAGKKPYLIPYGGSNAVGATAYAVAMAECMEQLSRLPAMPEAIVVASSSGGTQAGLVAGARLTGFTGEMIGIGIDKGERGPGTLAEDVRRLAMETLVHLRAESRLAGDAVFVNEEYHGDGYGVVGPLERHAIHALALQEGMLLDPVYTGRAMGAMIDLIGKGKFRKNSSVLFWHTGGAPALFAYGPQVL
jgi:D-cysteine desulfhydrase